MQTYPSVDAKIGDYPFAFEVDVAFISIASIERILSSIEGISNVERRRLFSGQDEIHLKFMYRGRDYVVWEPYGDSSRYWIGPKTIEADAYDLSSLEKVFKSYRPPFLIRMLGSLLSMRFRYEG